MDLKKNKPQIEAFSQNDDQVFSKIFSYLIKDYYFINKNDKNDFLMQKYVKIVLNFSFAASLFLGFTYVFQSVGLYPRKAIASTRFIYDTAVTLQDPSLNSKGAGYTLTGQDNAHKNSKRVIVAALQPKAMSRYLRASLSNVHPVRPSSMNRSRSSYYQVRTSIQPGIRTLFGVNFVQTVNQNQVVRITSMQLHVFPIKITKTELIRNESFSESKNLFVEDKVIGLSKIIECDRRLNVINKILSFQGWTDIDGVPTLIFNAHASHGRHYQNKRLSNVITKILEIYLEANKDLFTGGESIFINLYA